MPIFKFQRLVTCEVNLVGVGEIDPETGEVAFKDEDAQLESAWAWAESSWEDPYTAEEFIQIEAFDWELDEVQGER